MIADCWQNPYPHPHPILAAQNRPAPIQQQLRPTKLRQQRQCCFQDWGGHLRTGQGHVPWQFWNHNGCFDDLWFMMIYDDLENTKWIKMLGILIQLVFLPQAPLRPLFKSTFVILSNPSLRPPFSVFVCRFLVPSNIETLCLSLCLRFFWPPVPLRPLV